MSLELYHSNWSVCAQKVRLAIAEKNLDVVEHHVNLRAREQQSEAYLALNPKGYVPTLVHDGRPIVESALICEYLEDVFPDPPLRPADPADVAHMRSWTRRPDDGIHRACATLANAIAFRLQWLEKPEDEREAMLRDTPDPARRAWRREMIEHGTASPVFRNALWAYRGLLDDMERALAEGPWLCGADYSLADVSLTSYVNRAAEVQIHPLWERGYPRVTDWFARIRARENFSIAFGGYPYDDHAALMAEQGRQHWPAVEALLEAG